MCYYQCHPLSYRNLLFLIVKKFHGMNFALYKNVHPGGGKCTYSRIVASIT